MIGALFVTTSNSCLGTCLGVSSDPLFLWISSNSFPINLLLLQSHQAEIIIVKRLIQERNNVTRVRVEPRSCTQGSRTVITTPLPSLSRFRPYSNQNPQKLNTCVFSVPKVKIKSSLYSLYYDETCDELAGPTISALLCLQAPQR